MNLLGSHWGRQAAYWIYLSFICQGEATMHWERCAYILLNSATPCSTFTQRPVNTQLETSLVCLTTGRLGVQFPFIGLTHVKASCGFTQGSGQTEQFFLTPTFGSVWGSLRGRYWIARETTGTQSSWRGATWNTNTELIFWGHRMLQKNMWKQGRPQVFVSDCSCPHYLQCPVRVPTAAENAWEGGMQRLITTSVRSFQKKKKRTSFHGACRKEHNTQKLKSGNASKNKCMLSLINPTLYVRDKLLLK